MKPVTTLALLLLAVILLPQGAGAAALCGDMPAPIVVVRTAERPAQFDMKQNMEQLARIRQSAGQLSPHHYHSDVGGLMEGKISLDHKIGYNVKTSEKKGLSCVYATHVLVNLWLEPKVYVATDLQSQPCWYREVFAHEAKHVEADREVLRKYRFLFEEALNLLFLQQEDYTIGPFPKKKLDEQIEAMNATVENALGVFFNGMMRERNQIQQAIDSVHEYHEVSSRC